MKFLFDRRVVAVLRIVMGAVFVAAALPKLQEPEAFAKSVANYHLLPETASRVVALILPPLELLVGIFLIAGVFDAGASAIAFALMVIFTLAVGAALARGLDISCGCFETEGGAKVGMMKIVENLLMTLATWIVYRGDRSWLSLGSWQRARRMATAAGILLLSTVAAQFAQAEQTATPATKSAPPTKPIPGSKAAISAPVMPAPTRPFLWIIERGANPPAFLFGTIHLPDPRVLQVSPIVEEAFRGSDVLVTEIPLNEETNNAIAKESVRSEPETLAMILPPDVRDRADRYLQKLGFTLSAFSPLEIYTFAIQLPLLEYVKNPSPPLDALLHTKAVTAGKTTSALETAAEQLAVFESLSRAEQIELLDVTLDDLDETTPGGGPSPKIEELVQAYLSGDPAKLDEDLFGPMRKGSALQKRLLHDLLDARNVRLADRMDSGLREDSKQSIFYAVGAGHMIGNDGIVGRLQKKGWKVRRLQAADLSAVRQSLAEAPAGSR